jgi:tetratricopeptide (TPR) repeat protein
MKHFLHLIIVISAFTLSCTDGKEHIRLYNRACDYEDKGEYEKSIELLSKAIEIKPSDIYSYNNRAWDYLEIGRKDLAHIDFKTILKYDPKNTAAIYGLGYICYLDSNYKKAVALFDLIIEIKGGGPLFLELTDNHFTGQEKPLEADIESVFKYKKLSQQKIKE